MSLETRFAEGLVRLLAGCDGETVGLAVSGGGDSVALMQLARLCQPNRSWHVITVDHGLRPEAAEEAKAVSAAAKALGLPHTTLQWTGWDRSGNLQDEARQARRRLIADWARQNDVGSVCLGHTQDDQAETVLMRLARGSGVDGLCGMADAHQEGGIRWLRPLLGETRSDLRQWLSARSIPWVEDPSNEDERFDRVRTRRLLAEAAAIGVSATGLVDTAARMRAAREVLARTAAEAADRIATAEYGAIWLDRALWSLPDDTRWRLLSGAICLVSGNSYRPRLSALQAAEKAAIAGRNHTLHGCLIVPKNDRLCVQREPNALAQVSASLPGEWQGWQVDGPSQPGLRIAAVGETGLGQLPHWRDMGLSFLLAQTTPGIWRGDLLIAAPVLESSEWQAVSLRDKEAYILAFISH